MSSKPKRKPGKNVIFVDFVNQERLTWTNWIKRWSSMIQFQKRARTVNSREYRKAK